MTLLERLGNGTKRDRQYNVSKRRLTVERVVPKGSERHSIREVICIFHCLTLGARAVRGSQLRQRTAATGQCQCEVMQAIPGRQQRAGSLDGEIQSLSQ